MKLLSLGPILLLLVGIPSIDAAEKPAQKDSVAEFMQAKLGASQSVLEGIVTEDYRQIRDGAEKMIVMSKATEWAVIQGPVYAQHSMQFRRTAGELAKAAEKKDIDAAALQYVSLTMSCISCHKFVRTSKVVESP